MSKTNPTILNKKELNKEIVLKDGDEFTISERSFVFRAGGFHRTTFIDNSYSLFQCKIKAAKRFQNKMLP
jgi:hypothetical protein